MQPTDCVAADFGSGWYQRWSQALRTPAAKHPAAWELAAVAEALSARDLLEPGRRALGMAVRADALTSLLASHGVEVVATSCPVASARGRSRLTAPPATSRDDLHRDWLLERAAFDELVSFEAYDMTEDNPSFRGRFDVVWHTDAVGHLGSLEAAATQLLRSAAYLREGGWLIVTTDLNLASIDHTVHEGADTVLWRLEDLRLLFDEVALEHLHADPLRLRFGTEPADCVVNHLADAVDPDDPGSSELKVATGRYASTRVLLCFERDELRAPPSEDDRARAWSYGYSALQGHLLVNRDLADYYQTLDEGVVERLVLGPEVPVVRVELRPGDEAVVDLRFVNRSNRTLFDDDDRRPHAEPALTLQAEPIDGATSIGDDSWASPSCPAARMTLPYVRDEPDWHPGRVRPGEIAEFAVGVTAPAEPGPYSERFTLRFGEWGAVPGSEVRVDLVVSAAAPSPFATSSSKVWGATTPEQRLRALGFVELLAGAGHDGEAILAEYLDWVANLARREFRARLSMPCRDVLVFLNSWLPIHHPEVEVPPPVAQGLTLDASQVLINRRSLVPSDAARLIVVATTKRSGGTAISKAIADAGRWARYSVPAGILDVNKLILPTVLHTHTSRENLDAAVGSSTPRHVITIAREPIDVLISWITFRQAQPEFQAWGWREGDPSPRIAAAGFDSDEFVEWATGPQARGMLAVSASWWDHANTRIRYEEYKQDPVATLERVLRDIDPATMDRRGIRAVVRQIEGSYLVRSRNQHRWRGVGGYAEEYLSPERATAIRTGLRDVYDTLGL